MKLTKAQKRIIQRMRECDDAAICTTITYPPMLDLDGDCETIHRATVGRLADEGLIGGVLMSIQDDNIRWRLTEKGRTIEL